MGRVLTIKYPMMNDDITIIVMPPPCAPVTRAQPEGQGCCRAYIPASRWASPKICSTRRTVPPPQDMCSGSSSTSKARHTTPNASIGIVLRDAHARAGSGVCAGEPAILRAQKKRAQPEMMMRTAGMHAERSGEATPRLGISHPIAISTPTTHGQKNAFRTGASMSGIVCSGRHSTALALQRLIFLLRRNDSTPLRPIGGAII